MSEMDPQKANEAPTSPSPKKVIICFDGTNEEIGKSQPTNVAKTYEMLRLLDPAVQIAYYDPGVGTLPSATARGKLGRLFSRWLELAFGWGMRAKVAEAYTWLMQHYSPHDEVYVFGFSRGAYCARALVGMLNRPGLLRPGSENLVPYAVREYTMNRTPNAEGIQQFADAFCWGNETDPLTTDWTSAPNNRAWHAVPVQYVGLWDTVQAAGFFGFGKYKWPSTHGLYNAVNIRHAVSIDEWRLAYREFPVLKSRLTPNPADDNIEVDATKKVRIQETWFAGVHSDVGGTYQPDHRLAILTLKWVIDGVVECLYLRENDSYTSLFQDKDEDKKIDLDTCWQGEVHTLGFPWWLFGWHHRKILNGASVHATVKLKVDKDPKYKTKIPAGVTYVDQHWCQLIPQDRLKLPPPTPLDRSDKSRAV